MGSFLQNGAFDAVLNGMFKMKNPVTTNIYMRDPASGEQVHYRNDNAMEGFAEAWLGGQPTQPGGDTRGETMARLKSEQPNGGTIPMNDFIPFVTEGNRHFQRVGGTPEQPGFSMSQDTFKKLGTPNFNAMRQVVQNNPDWQFGQRWTQPQQGIGGLPQSLRYQPTYNQETKMIDGRPHKWDGTKWVAAKGY